MTVKTAVVFPFMILNFNIFIISLLLTKTKTASSRLRIGTMPFYILWCFIAEGWVYRFEFSHEHARIRGGLALTEPVPAWQDRVPTGRHYKWALTVYSKLFILFIFKFKIILIWNRTVEIIPNLYIRVEMFCRRSRATGKPGRLRRVETLAKRNLYL